MENSLASPSSQGIGHYYESVKKLAQKTSLIQCPKCGELTSGADEHCHSCKKSVFTPQMIRNVRAVSLFPDQYDKFDTPNPYTPEL